METQPRSSRARDGARAFAWAGALAFLVPLLGSDFLGPAYSGYVSVVTLLVNGTVAGLLLGGAREAAALSFSFLVAGISTGFGLQSIGVSPWSWVAGFALLGLMAGGSVFIEERPTVRGRLRHGFRGALSFGGVAVLLGLINGVLGDYLPTPPFWLTAFLAYWLPQVLGGAVFCSTSVNVEG